MIDGAPLVLKVGKIPGGFRMRTRGADLKVHVRSPRQAELAALMPEKLPPDTSKMLLCPMPGLIVKVDVGGRRGAGGSGALHRRGDEDGEHPARRAKGVVAKINAGLARATAWPWTT
jgi:propionyl-CoA carboxylase alpha chain